MGIAEPTANADPERQVTVILVCSGDDKRTKSLHSKGFRYLTGTGRKEATDAGKAIRDLIAGRGVRVVKVEGLPASHRETANAVAKVLGTRARWDEICYIPNETDIRYLEGFGVPFIVAVVARSHVPSGYGHVTVITFTYRWGSGKWEPEHVTTTVETL